MKNMKRIAAFSVAAVLAVSMMAGCGDDKKDKAEGSEAAGAGEETFLIGASAL